MSGFGRIVPCGIQNREVCVIYGHLRTHISKIYTKVNYGVALVSRIDKIIGLCCKRDLKKSRYSAKETYNLIDPTDRSHPKVQC